MNNINIFITGVFGYLGTALAKALLEDNFSVFGVDNLCYEQDFESIVKEINPKDKKSFTYNFADTRDFNLLENLVKLANPDLIIHFGDLSSVYSCNHNPKYTETVNIGGAINVIKICNKYKLPLLINSSSSIYGAQPSKHLCKESDSIPIPNDLYCASKVKIERILLENQYNNPLFKFVAFRPATVFGEGIRFRIELLPNHFCFSALHSSVIRVADLNAYRAFIHIDKLVDSYIHVIKNQLFNNQIYNIGSFNLTKLEVALSIQRNIDCKIVTMEDIGDLRNLQISCEKFNNDMRFDLTDDFDFRMNQLLKWLKLNLDHYNKTNFSGLLNMPLSNWMNLI